jgi:general secretion pathway protein C
VAVAEPTMPEVDPNAPPVKSGLRVKLLGTLVSNDPMWSFASVQDVATGKATTYGVGDRIMGAEVTDIERERVIVVNAGRREFIDNQPGDGAAPPLPTTAAVVAPPPPSSAPSSGLGASIRQMSDNEYEVPRAEIDRTLSNLNDVAMQARIVPAFKDGAAQGFKLFSIRPDSIYSKIGVQNGDVIRRINGFDLNSPEKALEVYTKLKDANRIEIELERNGAPIRKTYTVR